MAFGKRHMFTCHMYMYMHMYSVHAHVHVHVNVQVADDPRDALHSARSIALYLEKRAALGHVHGSATRLHRLGRLDLRGIDRRH